jgi:hypothetical protein
MALFMNVHGCWPRFGARSSYPRKGEDRLSDRKVGELSGPDETKKKKDGPAAPAKKRARRTADVGRALRTVYDETLREDVPDDFLDLLGKLS